MVAGFSTDSDSNESGRTECGGGGQTGANADRKWNCVWLKPKVEPFTLVPHPHRAYKTFSLSTSHPCTTSLHFYALKYIYCAQDVHNKILPCDFPHFLIQYQSGTPPGSKKVQ